MASTLTLTLTAALTSSCPFRACRFLGPILLAGLLGCGAGGGKDLPCSAEERKADVLAIMEDVYLFNDETTQTSKYSTDLGLYSDAGDLLDFLRYLPDEFDRGFSFITTTSSDAQFFGEGEYPGFGIFLSDLDQGELFITDVIPGSPAEREGMERGDQILAIGATTIDSDTDILDVVLALGPAEIGVARSFDLQAQGGGLRTLDLVSEIIVIDPLPLIDVIEINGGEMVGYMLFHAFIRPALTDLREAFAIFKTMGVTRLIVDLRYNGGGLLEVAETFNDLLGGPTRVGEVQYRQTFNPKYSGFDADILFVHEANSIDFDKIVFITTERSASASELIINSLFPYTDIDVAIVGDRTFGKPVGQGAFDFCKGELLLRAVAFQTLNSDGDGGYFEGLMPDCFADDDLSVALGDSTEPSLAAALTVIDTGMCPISMSAATTVTTVTTAGAARSETRESEASAAARGTTPWRREAQIY